jgi:flagellar motility protein MotE (MotC chaperone)
VNAPRLLPILAVAIGGVLAVNAVTGVADVPSLLQGAKAWAEEAASNPKAEAEAKAKAEAAAKEAAAKQPVAPGLSLLPPGKPAPPACAPTAAELARQAGLSPSELQVLQSLGARRNQLDQREQSMDVQLALMAAAEAKLDAKIKTLSGLKGDIQGLIGQADAQKQGELDRLVKVFETMKPKDAAARMAILDDSVRLHVCAKMKDRALSAILAQMSPVQAKELTEKLANRLAAADAAKQALAAAQPTPVAAAGPPPAPAKAAAAKPPAAKPTAAKPAPKPPAKPAQAAAAAAAPPAEPVQPAGGTPQKAG